MNRNQHSIEFREQALSKVRHRGTRSVREIAEELNMSAGTLRKWWSKSNPASVEATPTADLPSALAAESWTAAQRLLALQQTHGLSGAALNAWCREEGLFEHQLGAWRDAFCAVTSPDSREIKLALRDLQTRHEGLQRELRRKEKALAEAAALLVLQKSSSRRCGRTGTYEFAGTASSAARRAHRGLRCWRPAGPRVRPDRSERTHRAALGSDLASMTTVTYGRATDAWPRHHRID